MLSNDNFVSNSGRRAKRFRAVARALALLLLLTGGVRLATGAFPLVDPALSTAIYTCDPCRFDTDLARLIESESTRQRVRAAPGGMSRLEAHVAQPGVRLMLFVGEAARAVPFFIMFLGMALALRALAAKGFSIDAVSWLRRAALAALVWTLAESASKSIRSTALSPIADAKPTRHLIVDSDALLIGIIISGAAWVIVWALEEAHAIQRDLEEYV